VPLPSKKAPNTPNTLLTRVNLKHGKEGSTQNREILNNIASHNTAI
jgi:hypothetical protein